MKIALGIWLAFMAFSQAATLEFKDLLKEEKVAPDAKTVTTDFAFTNTSDKPVTISKSDPGCSCLKVEISGGKLKYAPGESGVVRTTFELGNFSGSVDKVIGLWLNEDAGTTPTMKLTVRIHIPVLISFEPSKTLSWAIGDKATPQTFHISMAEGETIRVTAVKSSIPNFVCELKTVEEGKKYDIVVTPLDLSVPSMAVLRIDTDCKISKHKTQQAFAVIRKPTPQTAAKP